MGGLSSERSKSGTPNFDEKKIVQKRANFGLLDHLCPQEWPKLKSSKIHKYFFETRFLEAWDALKKHAKSQISRGIECIWYFWQWKTLIFCHFGANRECKSRVLTNSKKYAPFLHYFFSSKLDFRSRKWRTISGKYSWNATNGRFQLGITAPALATRGRLGERCQCPQRLLG